MPGLCFCLPIIPLYFCRQQNRRVPSNSKSFSRDYTHSRLHLIGRDVTAQIKRFGYSHKILLFRRCLRLRGLYGCLVWRVMDEEQSQCAGINSAEGGRLFTQTKLRDRHTESATRQVGEFSVT